MIINNLSKVNLELRIISSTMGRSDNQIPPFHISCIVGVAPEGLSPFETIIMQQSPGDTVAASVPRAQSSEFFGHIYKQVCTQLKTSELPEIYDLEINIITAGRCEERDVIKAMAQSLGHSCGGGSCDCGCS